jgi:hypothetical protein
LFESALEAELLVAEDDLLEEISAELSAKMILKQIDGLGEISLLPLGI